MPTFCFACETLRSEDEHASFDEPCQKCGNTSTVSYEPGQEFHIVASGLKFASKPPEGGRWFYQGRIDHSHYKKDNEYHFIQRYIDTDRNRYYERIINKKTGEVVREVDEPLTEHTGRGSAKKKIGDSADEI